MYDYIIVGAGSAGCVLANRLSANPDVRVLLLEAGQPDNKLEIKVPLAFSKLFKTDYDWNYDTEPQPHMNGRVLYYPRGRTLGGSSSINAMIYIRGAAAIYDQWAQLGNAGWSSSELMPYFKRLEDFYSGANAYHNTGGALHVEPPRDPRPLSLAFVEAATQTGIPRNADFNGAQQEGAGLFHLTTKRAERVSAATAYLKPILKQRPNLVVQTSAHVERLLHDGERFYGVSYLHGDTHKSAHAHREILLCGGAINSPQLLMLSGVGDADVLSALGIPLVRHLRGVGQNLQDHLAAGVMYAAVQGSSLEKADSLGNLLKYMVGRIGPLTSNVAEACAYVRTQPDLPLPNIQYHFAPNFFLNHGYDNPPGDGFSVGAVLVTPQSRGELTLRSNDPLTPPRIQPNYLSDADGADMQALLDGIRLGRRIANAPALDAYRLSEVLPGAQHTDDDALREHIRNTSETLYHPVGTCKMGSANDPLAVVDAQLRVQGVRGVRVVDASIMPIIPNGNTNAPTLMIAEKAADLILADA